MGSQSTDISRLSGETGWPAVFLDSQSFDLLAMHPNSGKQSCEANACTLAIYIEGDGMAWRNRHQPSRDPTPRRAIGFELALQHPDEHVAYLARPCQYVGGIEARNCSVEDWTKGRYSSKVIASMNAAVNQLKDAFGARHLVLIGYSGGAAIAALIAARRDDVRGFISVAGILDHQTWTSHHAVSPLQDSLNPRDVAADLHALPQWHFMGGEDGIVPRSVNEAYFTVLDINNSKQVIVLPGYTHQCCWTRDWDVLTKALFGKLMREQQ